MARLLPSQSQPRHGNHTHTPRQSSAWRNERQCRPRNSAARRGTGQGWLPGRKGNARPATQGRGKRLDAGIRLAQAHRVPLRNKLHIRCTVHQRMVSAAPQRTERCGPPLHSSLSELLWQNFIYWQYLFAVADGKD